MVDVEEECVEEEEGKSQENQLVVVAVMVLLSTVGGGIAGPVLRAFVRCGMVKVMVSFLIWEQLIGKRFFNDARTVAAFFVADMCVSDPPFALAFAIIHKALPITSFPP